MRSYRISSNGVGNEGAGMDGQARRSGNSDPSPLYGSNSNANGGGGGGGGSAAVRIPGENSGIRNTPTTPLSPTSILGLTYNDLAQIPANELREIEAEAERRLRPFACGVGDCARRYKNMNELRCHHQHTGDHGAKGLALLASGQHECLGLGKRGQHGGNNNINNSMARTQSQNTHSSTTTMNTNSTTTTGVASSSNVLGMSGLTLGALRGTVSMPVSMASSRVGTPQPLTGANNTGYPMYGLNTNGLGASPAAANTSTKTTAIMPTTAPPVQAQAFVVPNVNSVHKNNGGNNSDSTANNNNGNVVALSALSRRMSGPLSPLPLHLQVGATGSLNNSPRTSPQMQSVNAQAQSSSPQQQAQQQQQQQATRQQQQQQAQYMVAAAYSHYTQQIQRQYQAQAQAQARAQAVQAQQQAQAQEQERERREQQERAERQQRQQQQQQHDDLEMEMDMDMDMGGQGVQVQVHPSHSHSHPHPSQSPSARSSPGQQHHGSGGSGMYVGAGSGEYVGDASASAAKGGFAMSVDAEGGSQYSRLYSSGQQGTTTNVNTNTNTAAAPAFGGWQ